MFKINHKVLNIVLLILLAIIVVRNNYLNKLGSILFQDSTHNYKSNREYKRQLDLYEVYSKKQCNYVMLGNSITQYVNWNELLNRTDIINRGIGIDVTAGFKDRLNHVINLKPKYCFIMGGINDILFNIKVDEILANYEDIILTLKAENIIPIIQSTLFVSDSYENANSINNKVDSLNSRLIQLSKLHDVKYLDLNDILSSNNNLKKSYTTDGIHLNGKGYLEWKKILTVEMKNHQLSD
ncbi:MAG: GDSL family lipase [Flavobacteriaceae bacterium]|nr:GDSL family lipase [Flavobacteriaceae bacterium]